MKEFKLSDQTRRRFVRDVSVAATGMPFIPALHSLISSSGLSLSKKNGMGIALVGLGSYATHQLAVALQHTEHCHLAGIVTGTAMKVPQWQEKYSIPDKNVYDYRSFDAIADNPDIDIVYVVLPNSLHAEYVIRAAEAGKHVICEKPMAITVQDCDRMIAACKKAGKMLSVGYRLHFEPYNLEMIRYGTKKIYGEIRSLSAGFGFPIRPNQWRLSKDYAGGGPLMDVGIYCIQAMCYTTGMEPIAVRAQEGLKTDFARFKEVEQSLSWQFEFPNGLTAEGITSYADGMNYLKVAAEKGEFGLTSAYNYEGQAGYNPDGKLNLPHIVQQARQMDAFVQAIHRNEKSIVPGEMGRRDVVYLQAIYEAMRSGERIPLN